MEVAKCLDEEVTHENLSTFLSEDLMFIQFFNSFLTLPIFQHRLIYNVLTRCFEQFQNILADDVNGEGNVKQATNLKVRFTFFKSTINERRRRIGYYVKFHSREQGLNWVIDNRLDLFLKSEIYADYKLARQLSVAQITFLNKLLDSFHIKIDDEKSDRNKISTHAPTNNFEISQHSSEAFSNQLPTSIPKESLQKTSLVGHQNIVEKDLNRSHSPNLSDDVSQIATKEEEIVKMCSSEGYSINAAGSVDLDPISSGTTTPCANFNLQNQKDSTNMEISREDAGNYSRIVSHRKSIAEFQEDYYADGQEFINIVCDDRSIVELLSTVNMKNSNDHVMFAVADRMNKFIATSTVCPLNLSYKEGIDAFKEFLYGTTGERNLLLWLEVERAKHYSQVHKKRTLQCIKDRFIRAGAPYEIPKEILKDWGIIGASNLSMERLFFIRRKILGPLLKYWVQRFTLHQYREKRKLINEAYTDAFSRIATDRTVGADLPQRPLSCINHLRTDSNLEHVKDNLDDADSGIFLVDEQFDGIDSGITRQKLRAKSAYSRLISPMVMKNTNVGYEQLQLVSSFHDEGFGFKPPQAKYYHNDASDNDHKNTVRLYIQPVPAFEASGSTIKSSPNFDGVKVEDGYVKHKEQLDALVDTLLHERHSGNYFHQFLTQHENRLWRNCYSFWQSLQEYTEYFFADCFIPAAIKRKANFIYCHYITSGGEYDLNCSVELQTEIFKRLEPPYEDLFDQVEEYVLNILLQPWLLLVEAENGKYETLKTEQALKYIEVNSKKRYKTQYDLEELVAESSDEGEEEEDKISPEEIAKPIPISKDGFNFEGVLRNRAEFEHFQRFLEGRHKQGIADLNAWTDMEVFRRLPRAVTNEEVEQRDKRAMEIREKWLSKAYFFGKTTPASKAAVQKILQMGGSKDCIAKRPPSPVILEAQRYSRARVERRWLLLFKETKEYLHRRKKDVSVTELVEDLLMKKKIERSEHAWRMLNTRWNSNSRDVTSLRLALFNVEERDRFRRFVRIRGDMMEQNLNFWFEVQKFKDMCHSHVSDSIIRDKIHTIIEVFIKSSVPPELQIDIPLEIAERMYEKACGKSPHHGPYLFREAQTTVFRIIYNFWKEYLIFREELEEGVTLDQALQNLEHQFSYEISRKKLLVERRRLGKLVNEKRRREHISKEREKAKQHDLLKLVSSTIASSEIDDNDVDVTSFLYSKYTAEGELKELEEKMKEGGFLINDDTTSTRKFSLYDTASVVSKSTKITAIPTFGTRQRRMSFFNIAGAMELRRQSLGGAYDKTEQSRARQSAETLTIWDGKSRCKSRCKSRGKTTSVKFRFGKSGGLPRSVQETSISKADTKTVFRIKFDQASHVTDLKNHGPVQPIELTDKQKKANLLTKRSLQEFEKTPEGKQLKVPLPLIHIEKPLSFNRSINDDERSEEQTINSNIKTTRYVIVNPRLPRNAGTAAILKKLEQEKRREESPPPEIMAEVVVC